MKCIVCGHQTDEHREARDLRLAQPYGVVAEGNPVHVCPRCGARCPALLAPATTLESLARWTARRAGGLHGTELWFVRDAMGRSQEQLGRRVGVAPETMSWWEDLKRPVGYQSELALRFPILAGSAVAEALDAEVELPDQVHVIDEQDVTAAG